MSRRGGGAVYEEHDYIREEVQRRQPVQVRERERPREYEEVDYIRRETTRESDRRPEFLRDDYDRPTGELVRIERETDTFSRPLERRPRSPSPVRYRERIVETSEQPVERVRTTRVVERERERSPSPPGQLRARVIETRERIPVRERSPSPIRYRERIIERERERSPSPARSERVRITETREEIRQAPSPASSPSPPPFIRAPPIHQEIITHHRHIDHVQARVPTPPPPPRRASPPRIRETDIDIHTSRNNTEVDIHTKNRTRKHRSTSRGRINFYDEDVIYEQERDKLKVRDNQLTLTRRRSVSARPPRKSINVDIRETESEADFYARKVDDRAYIGEAYNGATRDWAIVDVPPGTERVRMDGVGGGSQEITWQRYNGVRRSRFVPQATEVREEKALIEQPRREGGLEIDIHTSSRRRQGGMVYERDREYERVEEGSDRRVGFPRGPKNRVGDLWTEITKDLVVAEAIQQLGYDFEETEYFFYVLQYLRYEDVLQIVQLSEQIRRERQTRIYEIERERVRIERRDRERDEWERAERRRARALAQGQFDEERIIERDIIYEGRRPRRSGNW
ncbi:hypothetical protein OIDMADRAFT_100009 [Oidiodendron maius Zn]|uniref:DUF8035 domain-containing protein n=1 Tax=Oidiodendron maius (strain Zn) TaxID=913774 RepID=A0A0C3HIT7_OIDMZ|nr:hypothetical protein OIDMADRAFT_100009 [Oidiodendron maius Zn]